MDLLLAQSWIQTGGMICGWRVAASRDEAQENSSIGALRHQVHGGVDQCTFHLPPSHSAAALTVPTVTPCGSVRVALS